MGGNRFKTSSTSSPKHPGCKAWRRNAKLGAMGSSRQEAVAFVVKSLLQCFGALLWIAQLFDSPCLNVAQSKKPASGLGFRVEGLGFGV